jgi:lysophospholipase L1-like esterase
VRAVTHSRPRATLRASLVGALLGVIALGGCSNPTPTTSTYTPGPSIACPTAPATVQAPSSQGATVTYGTPTVANGTQPVTTTCAPPSNSIFAVGSTVVNCTATDAVKRAASCAFMVTVTPPAPRLGVTRILAFGDSITAGVEPGDSTTNGRTRAHKLFSLPITQTYPGQLASMLQARYTAQSMVPLDWTGAIPPGCPGPPSASAPAGAVLIVNAGCQKETAALGQIRLGDYLRVFQPDLLLLLEGTNDITTGTSSGPSPDTIVGYLLNMISEASVTTHVMVGTLLPMAPSYANAGFVDQVNARLATVVPGRGATLVDLNSDIRQNIPLWISSVDGLHPTPAGYQEMAKVWFNAISSAYEVKASQSPRKATSGSSRDARRAGR